MVVVPTLPQPQGGSPVWRGWGRELALADVRYVPFFSTQYAASLMPSGCVRLRRVLGATS